MTTDTSTPSTEAGRALLERFLDAEEGMVDWEDKLSDDCDCPDFDLGCGDVQKAILAIEDEAGAAQVQAADATVARLREALRRTPKVCPDCDISEGYKHKARCAINAALNSTAEDNKEAVEGEHG